MTRGVAVRWTALLCSLAILPGGYPQELRSLKVIAIEGDGGFNDIARRTAHDVVVEVRDEQGAPVRDAKVVFTAPANGASVLFADGSRTYVTTTDAQGRASARGLKPTAGEGRFTIQVTASGAGQRAGTAMIAQSNTLASGKPVSKGGSKKALILLLLAGGGAGVALGLTRSKGTTTAAAPTPTVLTVGSISVGGPR